MILFMFIMMYSTTSWITFGQMTRPDAKLAISSHYPYIDQPDRHPYDGYDKIYKWLIENDKLL